MPMENDVFVCGTCGSPAIDTWPFVHCYKCGAREDRPDLGQNADGSIMAQPEPVTPNDYPDGGEPVLDPEPEPL